MAAPTIIAIRHWIKATKTSLSRIRTLAWTMLDSNVRAIAKRYNALGPDTILITYLLKFAQPTKNQPIFDHGKYNALFILELGGVVNW
jgi:hypothetical protein